MGVFQHVPVDMLESFRSLSLFRRQQAQEKKLEIALSTEGMATDLQGLKENSIDLKSSELINGFTHFLVDHKTITIRMDKTNSTVMSIVSFEKTRRVDGIPQLEPERFASVTVTSIMEVEKCVDIGTGFSMTLKDRSTIYELTFRLQNDRDRFFDTVSTLKERREANRILTGSITDTDSDSEDESTSRDLFHPQDPPTREQNLAGVPVPPVPRSTSSTISSSEDGEVDQTESPPLLPSTVTELTPINGVKVYVVGTTHFSRQSQLDVTETLDKLQPSIMVLELCRPSSGMLTMTAAVVNRSLAKISTTNRQTGLFHRFLQNQIAQRCVPGVAPHVQVAIEEFLTQFPGCTVHFGDRDLSITVQRALSGLWFLQKVKLAWQFLKANDSEIMGKERDYFKKMASEFPSITKVLLDERDLYLAYSLWEAATLRIDPRTGTVVSNFRPIVGVVGMERVAGIVRNWGPIDQDKLEEIVEIPPAPLVHLIVGKLVKFSCYGILGLILYKGSRKVFSFPSDDLISSVAQKAYMALEQIKNQ